MPGWLKCIGILFFINCTIGGYASPATLGISRDFPDDSLLYKKIFSTVSPDPVISTDSPSCIIPFTRAGNLILIRAKVDTTEGNFILDTGAPGLVLNMTYFRQYPSTNAGDQEQGGGVTGAVSASNPTIVTNFSFGPIRYAKVEADRINLGHIETNKSVKIFGLLGMQLFKRFEMIIDYERSLIYLHLISKKEASTYKNEMLADPSTFTTVPIDVIDNKIIAQTVMSGKKLKFIIDTGAESNLLDSRLPDKIFDNVTINRRVLLNGTGDKKVEALYGDLVNMQLGNQDIGTLPVVITNLEKLCISVNYCLDGMLGFDFLSLHKIGFNFVNRKMYIWK